MTRTSYLSTVRRLAEETPDDRNRVADLLRVVSILVVVFGHWLMAAVTIADGELVPGHLLILADWTHPLTWVFQVMPVFFLVGGYSNALSWRSARRRNESYGTWLRARLRRLILPVVPLLVVWGGVGWLALRAGMDWTMLQLASQVALVPTWFLAAYVVIATLAPTALVIWERFGWWSIIGGTALAGLTDLLSLGAGIVPVGFLNYVFVWATVHQLGFAWVDGKLKGTSRRLGLAAVGLGATLALVWLGPYPVATVGLDTAQVTNSFPPRVTLAFLGMFQAGMVLVLEPILDRLVQRRRPWVFVVGVSAQIMTLYLCYLTAMIVAVGVGLALGGTGFGLEPPIRGVVGNPTGLVCGPVPLHLGAGRHLRSFRETEPRHPVRTTLMAPGRGRRSRVYGTRVPGGDRHRRRRRVERTRAQSARDRSCTGRDLETIPGMASGTFRGLTFSRTVF